MMDIFILCACNFYFFDHILYSLSVMHRDLAIEYRSVSVFHNIYFFQSRIENVCKYIKIRQDDDGKAEERKKCARNCG